MVKKQYGSLSLDLNDIQGKKFVNLILDNMSFPVILLSEPTGLEVYFKNNTICILKGKEAAELWNNFQEFSRTKVIKEAFEYVFPGKLEMYLDDNKGISFRNFPLRVFTNGNFNYNGVTGELTDFNFNSTFKAVWIQYAEQIKAAYEESIRVNPVKIAEEVLKSRGLDSKWTTEEEDRGYPTVNLW